MTIQNTPDRNPPGRPFILAVIAVAFLLAGALTEAVKAVDRGSEAAIQKLEEKAKADIQRQAWRPGEEELWIAVSGNKPERRRSNHD